jgi:hypothetical protein
MRISRELTRPLGWARATALKNTTDPINFILDDGADFFASSIARINERQQRISIKVLMGKNKSHEEKKERRESRRANLSSCRVVVDLDPEQRNGRLLKSPVAKHESHQSPLVSTRDKEGLQ